MLNFKSIVFSGGGSRCVWQAGFYHVLSKHSEFKPKNIAAASAGATMACLILAGKTHEGLDYFKDVTSKNEKNAYWSNLFSDRPVFPHYEIYRKMILDLFDESAISKLKKGPKIKILISQPPFWLGPRSGTLVGILAYSIEKKLIYPVHPKLATRLGFKPIVVSIDEIDDVNGLADLLLQSSCTPPFVPVMRRNGKPTLDGGLIDNVPLRILGKSPDKTLVLLSRQYPEEKVSNTDKIFYVQPSEPINIDKWDYTNPEGLQYVYDLGIKDADSFVSSGLCKP